MACSSGLAVFVKTPGLTPLKTRLAAGIGVQAAEEFYRLSCLALEETLQSSAGLQAYWALAEASSEAFEYPLWARLPRLPQGEGQLGLRLDSIYRQLLTRHSQAILIGADTPHLPKAYIESAMQKASEGGFVVGPADDGGFYLFAGTRPIPPEVWTSVGYSCESTLHELLAALGTEEAVTFLPPLRDIDSAEDLSSVLSLLAHTQPKSPGALDLLTWFEALGLKNATPQPK